MLNWLKLLGEFIKVPQKLDEVQSDIRELKEGHKEIREALIAKGLIKPYTRQKSPRQITERGHELLGKSNIGNFLADCDLVKQHLRFKNKDEVDIYSTCIGWVKSHGERKVFEIMYESDISEDQCIELLALAIKDEILSNLTKMKSP